MPDRHRVTDHWKTWRQDILLAERILIYKYSPHYNYVHISGQPDLTPFDRVVLVHRGDPHRLKSRDVAPDSYL